VSATYDHLLLFHWLWWVIPLANDKGVFCLLWWRVVVVAADRLVPHHSAEVSCATCSGEAGVNTVETLTGFIQGTIIIYEALSLVTASIPGTHCPCRALTAVALPLQDTHSTWATGARHTRVRLLHTLLLGADIAVLAVRVSGALRSTACYRVWLRDETGETFAYGVTSSIGAAGGSWATGRGITRIRFLHASLTFAYKTICSLGR